MQTPLQPFRQLNVIGRAGGKHYHKSTPTDKGDREERHRHKMREQIHNDKDARKITGKTVMNQTCADRDPRNLCQKLRKRAIRIPTELKEIGKKTGAKQAVVHALHRCPEIGESRSRLMRIKSQFRRTIRLI
jgi:hypothetical protein